MVCGGDYRGMDGSVDGIDRLSTGCLEAFTTTC